MRAASTDGGVMLGHRVAIVAGVFAAGLAIAGVASGRQPALTTTLSVPAAPPGRRGPAIVLVNPGRVAITARLRFPGPRGADHAVRDVRIPATAQRTVRIDPDIARASDAAGPATVSIECLDERRSGPCPNETGVLAYVPPAGLEDFVEAGPPRWNVPPSPWAAMTWIESRVMKAALAGAAAAEGSPTAAGTLAWPWTRMGSPFVSSGGFPDVPLSPAGEWYFAEGFTGGGPFPLKFATDFVVRNPDGSREARVELTFVKFRGKPVTENRVLAPGGQAVIRVHEIPGLENVSFSARVISRNHVPILAWRVVQWGPPPAPPEAWSAANWTAVLVRPGLRELAARWAFPVVHAGEKVDAFFPVFNPTGRPMRVRATAVQEDGSGTRFLASGWIAPMSRYTVLLDVPKAFAWRCPCTVFLESIAADEADEPVPFVAESSVYWPRGWWSAGVGSEGTPWAGRVAQPPVVAPRPLTDAERRRSEQAPAANVAAWFVAALALGALALWSRRSPRHAERAAPGWAVQTRLALIVGAGLAAVVWPTSIDGSVSRILNVVAILGTAAAVGAAAVLPGGRGSRVAVVNAAIIMGLLGVATIFTPLTSVSPGVVFIYLGLALLLVLDVRDLHPGRAAVAAFAAIHVVIVVFGLGTLLGVDPINRMLAAWYSYYRSELVHEMIADHKPVAMFVTHSLAGFVFYLLGAAALVGARRSAGWWGLAGVYLLLLAGLRSTTGNILLGLAAAQAAWLGSRQFPGLRRPLLAAAALGMSAILVWLVLSGPAGADRVRALFVGDRIHGFLVRFGPDGLMEENIEYLRRHPLMPIGFGFSDQLYLGDCGILVTLLRGGFPAVLCVYGGLLAFFRRNVRGVAAAVWLWAVTTAFEIGFQPLQSFRFVGLLPLYVVCLNALLAGRDAGPSRADGSTGPQ
jgi:hypothetical protein